MLSFSLSLEARLERRFIPTTMRTTTTPAATGRTTFHLIFDFVEMAAGGGNEGEEPGGCTAILEEDVTFAACAGESGIAGIDAELCAMARPLSVSRFRRCRSARISAAL